MPRLFVSLNIQIHSCICVCFFFAWIEAHRRRPEFHHLCVTLPLANSWKISKLCRTCLPFDFEQDWNDEERSNTLLFVRENILISILIRTLRVQYTFGRGLPVWWELWKKKDWNFISLLSNIVENLLINTNREAILCLLSKRISHHTIFVRNKSSNSTDRNLRFQLNVFD